MAIDAALIKKLRDETGAPVIRVKQVLDENKGDEKTALTILRKEGFEKVAKREGRATSVGRVFSYVHHTGTVASLVSLACETDFVARNELFGILGKNIAMQVVSTEPKNVEELVKQEFIKDPSKTVSDLIKEVIAKTGENVKVEKFARVKVGED